MDSAAHLVVSNKKRRTFAEGETEDLGLLQNRKGSGRVLPDEELYLNNEEARSQCDGNNQECVCMTTDYARPPLLEPTHGLIQQEQKEHLKLEAKLIYKSAPE
jgi:hypothetical protein